MLANENQEYAIGTQDYSQEQLEPESQTSPTTSITKKSRAPNVPWDVTYALFTLRGTKPQNDRDYKELFTKLRDRHKGTEFSDATLKTHMNQMMSPSSKIMKGTVKEERFISRKGMSVEEISRGEAIVGEKNAKLAREVNEVKDIVVKWQKKELLVTTSGTNQLLEQIDAVSTSEAMGKESKKAKLLTQYEEELAFLKEIKQTQIEAQSNLKKQTDLFEKFVNHYINTNK